MFATIRESHSWATAHQHASAMSPVSRGGSVPGGDSPGLDLWANGSRQSPIPSWHQVFFETTIFSDIFPAKQEVWRPNLSQFGKPAFHPLYATVCWCLITRTSFESSYLQHFCFIFWTPWCRSKTPFFAEKGHLIMKHPEGRVRWGRPIAIATRHGVWALGTTVSVDPQDLPVVKSRSAGVKHFHRYIKGFARMPSSVNQTFAPQIASVPCKIRHHVTSPALLCSRKQAGIPLTTSGLTQYMHVRAHVQCSNDLRRHPTWWRIPNWHSKRRISNTSFIYPSGRVDRLSGSTRKFLSTSVSLNSTVVSSGFSHLSEMATTRHLADSGVAVSCCELAN